MPHHHNPAGGLHRVHRLLAAVNRRLAAITRRRPRKARGREEGRRDG
jgi:hypothetical protein